VSADGWLEGKVALVTGGGSGIGRAVVEAYLEQGASVCVIERDEGKCADLGRLGERVSVVAGDATVPETNERGVEDAVERFGRLDVLATFVGIFDNYVHLTAIPAERLQEAFDETFTTNVASVLHAARAAAPSLREAKGSIIVTCSSSSFYPGRGGTLYVASKFALRGVVVQLAHELAPDVRVNGVAPGGTLHTDLRGLRSLGQFDDRLDDRPGRAEGMIARTPLAVALTPADHVGAYVYLASDRAAGLTGEVIRSDGGLGAR
jgi:2,3-dihydroxy-2,3-dihydrophenylpropionate dehydrogenase